MKTLELKPTVKITVKKNTLKVYNVDNVESVYLKDNSEFEIELFNPTQDVLLCKIKLNGKQINGGGLVLNPGQRIFLERFLDSPKKFKFETYEVDDTPEVRYAINNNGLVEVEFYREVPLVINFEPTKYTYCDSRRVVLGGPSSKPNFDPFYTTCGTASFNGDSTFYSTATPSINYCVTADTVNSSGSYTITASSNIFETGRVEEGSNSDQKFVDVNKTFQVLPFQISKVKILPDSQKIYTADDLKHRKYCSECGKKVKTNDKFCSQCGTKL